jgi:hypothetical protein
MRASPTSRQRPANASLSLSGAWRAMLSPMEARVEPVLRHVAGDESLHGGCKAVRPSNRGAVGVGKKYVVVTDPLHEPLALASGGCPTVDRSIRRVARPCDRRRPRPSGSKRGLARDVAGGPVVRGPPRASPDAAMPQAPGVAPARVASADVDPQAAAVRSVSGANRRAVTAGGCRRRRPRPRR